MKRRNVFLGLTILMAAVALYYSYERSTPSPQHKGKTVYMDAINTKLAAGELIEKEMPFTIRPFSPYLNGEWIGNAISYGCYRRGQAPGVNGPSEAEILEDLNIITQYWNLIRVYGADVDAERVLRVIKKHNLPVRVMLGVWLENETDHPERRAENITQVLRAIELANQYPDLLFAISVGNESQVFWSAHRMQPEHLIRYIRAVRNHTDVPVTTADDYNFWNKPESQAVAEEIDFIVTHIYPMWNGKTLDIAVEWLGQTYHEIKAAHPDKEVIIGETGWATTYNPDKNGPGEQGSLIKGEVSIAAQERYLIMHNAWVNENRVPTFLFEAFDEPWKGGGEATGPNEVEKHWGVFYENRTPKASFQNYLKQILNQPDKGSAIYSIDSHGIVI